MEADDLAMKYIEGVVTRLTIDQTSVITADMEEKPRSSVPEVTEASVQEAEAAINDIFGPRKPSIEFLVSQLLAIYRGECENIADSDDQENCSAVKGMSDAQLIVFTKKMKVNLRKYNQALHEEGLESRKKYEYHQRLAAVQKLYFVCKKIIYSDEEATQRTSEGSRGSTSSRHSLRFSSNNSTGTVPSEHGDRKNKVPPAQVKNSSGNPTPIGETQESKSSTSDEPRGVTSSPSVPVSNSGGESPDADIVAIANQLPRLEIGRTAPGFMTAAALKEEKDRVKRYLSTFEKNVFRAFGARASNKQRKVVAFAYYRYAELKNEILKREGVEKGSKKPAGDQE